MWLAGWLFGLSFPIFLFWSLLDYTGGQQKSQGFGAGRALWCLNHGNTGVIVSSNLCKREVQPLGQDTELKLRLQTAAKCVVQLPAAQMWYSYLMVKPGAGDLRSPSVSEDIVLHAFHAGVFSHFRPEWRLVLFHFCQENKQTQGYSAGLHWCQVQRELAVLWRSRSYWLAAQCHRSAWTAPNKAKPVGIFKTVSNVFLPHGPSPLFFPRQLNNFHLNPLVHNHISNSQSSRITCNGLWAFRSVLRQNT